MSKIDIVPLPTPAPLLRGISLEHALQNRRSTRAFLPQPLSWETISAILWSGFGCNRRETGGRTAPSAHGWQEIDVYVVLGEGTYRYDCKGHQLAMVNEDDLRGLTGTQEFVGSAPLNLVYVADFGKMTDCRAEHRAFFAGADSACVAQNVYLFCAGAGLATVMPALVDRRQLAHALGLSVSERITFAQTVGWSAEDPVPSETEQSRRLTDWDAPINA